MADFTPGPLTIKGPSPGGTPCDDGGDYAIIDSDGFIIAEAISKVGRADRMGRYVYRPAEANARLIAKSPDMYGALKSLMKKTDCNDYNYLEVYSINNLLAEIDGEEIPFPDLTEKPPWHKT